jgi:hypothetical protein
MRKKYYYYYNIVYYIIDHHVTNILPIQSIFIVFGSKCFLNMYYVYTYGYLAILKILNESVIKKKSQGRGRSTRPPINLPLVYSFFWIFRNIHTMFLWTQAISTLRGEPSIWYLKCVRSNPKTVIVYHRDAFTNDATIRFIYTLL